MSSSDIKSSMLALCVPTAPKTEFNCSVAIEPKSIVNAAPRLACFANVSRSPSIAFGVSVQFPASDMVLVLPPSIPVFIFSCESPILFHLLFIFYESLFTTITVDNLTFYLFCGNLIIAIVAINESFHN